MCCAMLLGLTPLQTDPFAGGVSHQRLRSVVTIGLLAVSFRLLHGEPVAPV